MWLLYIKFKQNNNNNNNIIYIEKNNLKIVTVVERVVKIYNTFF